MLTKAFRKNADRSDCVLSNCGMRVASKFLKNLEKGRIVSSGQFWRICSLNYYIYCRFLFVPFFNCKCSCCPIRSKLTKNIFRCRNIINVYSFFFFLFFFSGSYGIIDGRLFCLLLLSSCLTFKLFLFCCDLLEVFLQLHLLSFFKFINKRANACLA